MAPRTPVVELPRRVGDTVTVMGWVSSFSIPKPSENESPTVTMSTFAGVAFDRAFTRAPIESV